MTCGRKHCTKCGCWRHAIDFGRHPGHPTGLQSHCRTCQRVTARERVGLKRRGKPFKPQRREATAGIPRRPDGTLEHTSEEFRAYQRDRYQKLSEAQRADRRERQRIWHEGRRRARGIPARPLDRETPGFNSQVFVAPFATWLDDHADNSNLKAWAYRHQIDESLVSRILKGGQDYVSIDTVDRVLVAAGQPHLLNELYPVEVAA